MAAISCSMLAAYTAASAAGTYAQRGTRRPRRACTSGCAAARAAASGQTNTSVVHTQPAVRMAVQS